MKFLDRFLSPTSPAGSFYAATAVAMPMFVMVVYSLVRIYNSLEGGRMIMLGAIFVYLTFVAGILLVLVTLVSGYCSAIGVLGVILSSVALAAIVYVGYVVFKSDVLMALSLWGGFPAIAVWILRLELLIEGSDEDDYDDEDYYDDDDDDDDDSGDDNDDDNSNHNHRSYGYIDPETNEKIRNIKDILDV